MTVLAILLKVTIITGCGLIAVRATQRQRASLRHMFLIATFVLALLVPLTTMFGPTFCVTVPSVTQTIPKVQQSDGGADTVPLAAGPASDHRTDDGRSAVISPLAWLLGVWLIGVACLISPVLLGSARVRSLRRSSLPWPDDAAFRDAVEAARARTTRRDVALFLNESVAGPITWGVLRPIVVLPAEARTWSAADLERALIHEFEHIRRYDWLTQRVARGVCAIYWFHPLLWTAWHRLALEAEQACDDAVISQGEAAAYADQLIRLAERQAATGRPAALLAMTGRHHLATRVHALLDRRRRRGRLGLLTVLVLSLGVTTAAVATSPIRLVPIDHVEQPSLAVPPLSAESHEARREVRMPKRKLPIALTALLTTGVVAPVQPAGPQEPVFSVNYNPNYLAENGLLAESDEDFIKHAARLSAIVIQAGKLALTKSSNAEVKAFAEQLVNDHTATRTEVVQWATKKNVGLKDDDPSVRMKLDRHASLQTRTGADFDREFVAAMSTDESDAIALFTNEWRNSKDAALGRFAQTTLPTLRAHKSMARKLKLF